MKNNIFEYATGELSQDAFICWCANWFNDESRPRLREMSVEFIKRLAGVDHVDSVRVLRQYSRDVYIEDERYALKIDVLILVNQSIAVIVEDKTYTGEHDNQIQRYKDGITWLSEHASFGDDFYSIKEVRTVYFKTGFLYDDDRCVQADVTMSGEDFLASLQPYAGVSEILDSYIAHLSHILQWYVNHGSYEGTDASAADWNISRHQIAQYRLMRDIFPEELWSDHDSWRYRVWHGSNKDGSPWTEMQILDGYHPDSEDYYEVFWKINGLVISLRLYEKRPDTYTDVFRIRHKGLYEMMSSLVENITREGTYCRWEDVYSGYRGNYRESALIEFDLRERLLNWQEEGPALTQEIQRITSEFQNRMNAEPQAESVKDSDIYTLGTYPQSADGEEEPIQWIVLDHQNDRVLLMSDKVLDTRAYHHEYANEDGAILKITWKYCDIRHWLNAEFLEQAFSEQERERVIDITLENPDNPVIETRGGESTVDRIFLLSMADALKYFDSTGRTWGPEDDDGFSICTCELDDIRATATLTDYVREQSGQYAFGGFSWWLRTPGDSGNAACVDKDGNIYVQGGNVDNDRIGVRPALWIRIKSST